MRRTSCKSLTGIIVFLSGLFFAPVLEAEESRFNVQALPADTLVNPDGETYDSHPSAVVGRDGATWIAWHAYHDKRDRVLLRRVAADGKLGTLHTVSEGGSVHGPPTIVLLGGESVWVVWSGKREGRWRVVGRKLRGDVWGPVVRLSEAGSDAIYPKAARVSAGTLLVAWSAHRDGRFGIRSRVLKGDVWGEAASLSSGEHDAFRSALAVDEMSGTVWTFWDRYDGARYNVHGRRTLPAPGPIEQISPAGGHCLTPTALFTKQGLCVAWLQKEDVIGGPGVVSQWHTLHAAIRGKDGWKSVADSQGNTAAAELTQGLVAQVEPKVVATGGYLGRRAAPMLLEDGETLWLLWERKATHRGSTPNVLGDLVGRSLRDGLWQQRVLLRTGRVDYHLAHPQRADGGRFVVLASPLPRKNRRLYHRVVANLNETQPFQQEPWTGWRPVDLPIPGEQTERRSIRMGETEYYLFWADMHCHNGLTSDAEGEPDELMHYARDRAKLDVVVFTNNDFLYDVPLTEYEYALGNFFAAAYERPGTFVSLPGYEWTSRIPGAAGARVSDRGNWTPPYRNRSYPNHRSVVYKPSGGPVVRFPEVANDIRTLNSAVAKAGGLTFTQHDAFQTSGGAVEVGMELTSGWRNYIHRVPKLFHEPLNRGLRLGFVANGDSHRRAPGLSGALTGIYAEELTADSIFDALRNRRCFATNGSRIFVDARANGRLMGEEVAADGVGVTLTLRAKGTRPIVSAVLVRDGEEVHTVQGDGTRDFQTTFQDTQLGPGKHWYYWRVSQQRSAPQLPGNLMAAHGHLAWSTPHFVAGPKAQ